MKQKRVTHSEKTTKEKDVKQLEVVGYFDKYPSWRFSMADFDSAWSPKAILEDSRMLRHLIDRERQTWAEIFQAKKQNHFIRFAESPSKAARDRANEIHLTERVGDELFSLRLEGDLRLLGSIHDGVFFVIWYDPTHDVWPSPKKHT
ncbi:MAG: hypothetical protein FWB76_05345 [Oscillospiraceae bacterium]|nr:hypothetical protein [Oscillospiraceae bacterium]